MRNLDMLKRATGGLSFYNTSKLDFQSGAHDQDNVANNLKSGIGEVLREREGDPRCIRVPRPNWNGSTAPG